MAKVIIGIPVSVKRQHRPQPQHLFIVIPVAISCVVTIVEIVCPWGALWSVTYQTVRVWEPITKQILMMRAVVAAVMHAQEATSAITTNPSIVTLIRFGRNEWDRPTPRLQPI